MDISLGKKVTYVILVASIILIAISIVLVFAIFRTSHYLIRPLRQLNTKMEEIMTDNSLDSQQIEINEAGTSSFEISKLYIIFKDLI